MVIFVLKRRKVVYKLFNVKYLPLFHHFKAIYQFPKHIIFLVKIVANAFLVPFNILLESKNESKVIRVT
jgi:hypothetical protein